MGSQGKHWEVKHRQQYADILTKEVLLDATAEKISDYTLAERLQIPHQAVWLYRKRLHIPSAKSDSAMQKIKLTEISVEQIGLIVGTVLGDGYLHKNRYGDAYLTICHGIKQKDYVTHKRKLLDNLCIAQPQETENKSGYKIGNKRVSFCTLTHPDLTKLCDLFYPKGKKIVTKEVLNLLTIAGFVWWFFDDGTRDHRNGRYSLATQSFTLEENKLIREYLFKKLKLYTSVVTHTNAFGKTYYHLYFAARSQDLMTQYLKSFAIPCMEYKINRSSETTRETTSKQS
jgi:hypothetical protein